MEFNEKLQRLRAKENLTQEELAEKLFVSRTAISKWESGRGYPSIDSLKTIAKYFHVTIDELICGEEMAALAEQNVKESNKKITSLLCGMLDCLILLLFFLPVFGDRGTETVFSVPMTALTGVSGWLKAVFIAVTGLTAINGFCAAVISGFDRPVWNKRLLMTGMALSITGTVIFVLARQPYAGIFSLCLLVAKGFFLHKSQ